MRVTDMGNGSSIPWGTSGWQSRTHLMFILRSSEAGILATDIPTIIAEESPQGHEPSCTSSLSSIWARWTLTVRKECTSERVRGFWVRGLLYVEVNAKRIWMPVVSTVIDLQELTKPLHHAWLFFLPRSLGWNDYFSQMVSELVMRLLMTDSVTFTTSIEHIWL